MNMTPRKALLIVFATYASLVFVLNEYNLLGDIAWVVFIYASVLVLGAAVIYVRNTRWWIYPKGPFSAKWKQILLQEVSYYKVISDAEKRKFEKKVLFFLSF